MTPLDLVVTPHAARFLGRAFPVSVGRSGIVPPGAKREGDGATPAGVHTFTGCLCRPDRLARTFRRALPVQPFGRRSDFPTHRGGISSTRPTPAHG